MNRVRFLIYFSAILLLTVPVLQSKAQTSNLKIVHEPYQWTEDMKRLKITTPELGLTFKITISNEGTEPLEINHLFINVRVESEERSDFFRQIQLDYLYLPPKESQYHFVKVSFGGGIQVGSYTAKLTYTIGSSLLEGNPIEEYPFEFRILSDEMLQQEIQQNKGGTTLNLNIYVEITLGGVIAVSVPVGLYLWNKRNKEKERTSQADKTRPRKK